MAVGGDKPVGMDDEAAPGLVDGIGPDMVGGAVAAAHLDIGLHVTADQNHRRLDAKNTGLELRVFVGRCRAGPDQQQKTENGGTEAEGAGPGARAREASRDVHSLNRIPELSAKGKKATVTPERL